MLSFIPRLAQKGFMAEIDRVLEAGCSSNFSYVFMTKAGYLVDLDLTLKPLDALRETTQLFFRFNRGKGYNQHTELVVLVGAEGQLLFQNSGI